MFDHLNLCRLKAPHGFYPMRTTRAVQKASEGYGD
jgi:hypothetical protein